MSLIPSPSRLKLRIISTIVSAGNKLIHHWEGIYFEPSETIVPKSGVGGWAPRPKKLRVAPIKIVHPTSKVILVNIGAKQLGNISLNRIWELLAPVTSAACIKYSFLIEEAIPYTSLVGHGHQLMAMAIIALNRVGSNIEQTAKASAGDAGFGDSF